MKIFHFALSLGTVLAEDLREGYWVDTLYNIDYII